MRRCRPAALIVISLALGASTVEAEASFYLSAKLGNTSTDRDLELAPFDTADEDEDSWGVGFGYRVNRHLAAQAEYLDLGGVSHTRLCGPPEVLCLSQPPVTLDIEGLSVSLVPRFPLGRRAAVFGKLGVVRLNTKMSSLLGVEGDRDSDEIHYGAGLRFEVRPKWSLVAEYEEAGSEISNVSLGASFEF